MKSFQQRRAVLLNVMVAIIATITFTKSVTAVELSSSSKTKEHQVVIQAFKFEPTRLKLKVGDRISWLNKDIVPHTATAADGSWDTGEILTNKSKSITFTIETTSSYYCFYHPTMKGKLEIIVVD